MTHELNAILAIATRDFLKLIRDPTRMVATLVFPLIFIGVLGPSLQANLGSGAGFDLLLFVFTGIYAQTLFQSTAIGLVSLIEDRENDFSQEVFVAPISRYSIIFGKILGETFVAFPQGLAIVIFGLVIGVAMTLQQFVALILVGLVVCLFGGAFGVIVLANLKTQRAANQVFPFIFLPQFFLAGVFNPIQVLPIYLEVLSRISPMRYAVDITRIVFYSGHPDFSKVTVDSAALNVVVVGCGFVLFLATGTLLFVRGERNR